MILVYLLVGVVLLVAGGIIGSIVVRSLKGSLRLTLDRTGATTGEELTGSVRLQVKKRLECRRLFVSLICTETESWKDDDGQQRSEVHELYRGEQNILGEQALLAGHDETYPFTLPVPSAAAAPSRRSSGPLGGMSLEIGGFKIGGRNVKIAWRVEARLDIPGLDLVDSKSVTISTT